MKKETNRRLKGFGGVTHVFASLVIVLTLILIPVPFLSDIFVITRSNFILFIISMIVLAGGALLPDLDNDVSSAGYSLELIGSLVKSFMKTTATITWEMYHMKNDKKPPTAHRLLWHAPIVGILFIMIFAFGIKPGDGTIFSLMQEYNSRGELLHFFLDNSALALMMFMSFMAVFAGTNLLLWFPKKLIKLPKMVDYTIPLLVIVYILTTSMTNVRSLGILVGTGYLLHVLEDLFSQGSIPIIWPIPAFWLKKVWWKPWVPGAIYTGGIINTILNYILEILFVFLLIFVLTK